ncbi:hypothetical protein LSTR_LSTR012508 [Laodelphax striatellus]|uniref:NR LBD domain-containing protein n=1 Tax=Laodelphax striatellus TaxID=195883 RepID=A0A482XKS4_LAOST|nr:hypothetical protein LSTR_LSTR012508 [Laodelphax striatellus]
MEAATSNGGQAVSVKWTGAAASGGGGGGDRQSSDSRQTGTTVIASGPVTVTSINVPPIQHQLLHHTTTINKNNATCFQQHLNGVGSGGGGGSVIRGKCNVLVGNIALGEDEGSGSDAEVSKIDFSGVNMRNKKKKKKGGGGVSEDESSRDGLEERPMSWEGELSDSEMKSDVVVREGEGEEVSMEVSGGGECQQPAPLKFTSEAAIVDKVLEQEMMEVEHLWQYNEQENRPSRSSNPGSGPDFLSNLCNIADHRLYKIVKWCKSLPLFKNISIDDQISLLINAWCELLLFSCCFRSMSSPGEIRVSLGKCISLGQARQLGLGPAIERMLNFTEHLRRLRVDRYEYVAMKKTHNLDASDLREPEKVRASQEKALQALQHYTLAHYPDIPSKFGELLLRIPDLQRTCQVGKEMLSLKNKEGEGPSFNLLMELLRGDH